MEFWSEWRENPNNKTGLRRFEAFFYQSYLFNSYNIDNSSN